MALVVGVPAITNVDEGVVLAVSTLDNWRSVPLGAMLRRGVDCMVVVENDTNLSALGERLRGAARGAASFVALDIGTNVSAGIVLDGRLYHGAQWSAGEIGYLRLPHITRRQPSLHEFGELEAILSSSGIRKSWHDMAQRGEPTARKIVRQRAAIVADVIVNLALILNPGLVLLGGEVGRHPALLSFVSRELEQCEFAVPRIDTAMLGEAGVLCGAIAVALEAIPSILLPSS
jgi:glucokinase